MSSSTAQGGSVGLDLAALHTANIARQAEWCPDQVPDLSYRGNELAGETGEACNVIKKLERERQGWRGSRANLDDLAQELADVVICADLCAVTAGIDLAEAVVTKFNATSEKQGLATKLPVSAALASGAGAEGGAGRVPAAPGDVMKGWRPINTLPVLADRQRLGLKAWPIFVPGKGQDWAWDDVPEASLWFDLPDPGATPAPATQAPSSAAGGVAQTIMALVTQLRRHAPCPTAEATRVLKRGKEAYATLAAAPQGAESRATREVLAERRRQVEAESWTTGHDDEHAAGEMATAAACYAYMGGADDASRRRVIGEGVPYRWPWSPEWWKPTDRRRDLVKAGALILAEIERLDRLAPTDRQSADGEAGR